MPPVAILAQASKNILRKISQLAAMALRSICLLAIVLLAAEAEVLQGNDANATTAVAEASLGEDVKVGTYDELMDETEDSSDDVDEDETTEEEGSGYSDDDIEAIKSEKGDETEAIMDDSNATSATPASF